MGEGGGSIPDTNTHIHTHTYTQKEREDEAARVRLPSYSDTGTLFSFVFVEETKHEKVERGERTVRQQHDAVVVLTSQHVCPSAIHVTVVLSAMCSALSLPCCYLKKSCHHMPRVALG